jgi:hypothetical protein
MSDTKNIPWPRIGADAVAILVSILLAFAIDAWWANRLENREMVVVLNRLSAEFESNYTMLSDFQERCRTQCRAAQAADSLYLDVLAALGDGAEHIEVEDEMLAALLATPTFEAETPVLDGLVRSGRIQKIEDQKILSAIAFWDRMLRNTAELEARGRTNVDSRLMPILVDRGDIGHIIRDQMRRRMFDDVDLNGTTTLRLDAQLKAAIAARFENSSRANLGLDRMKEAADAVLIAIGNND